jgi:hypothetical protein
MRTVWLVVAGMLAAAPARADEVGWSAAGGVGAGFYGAEPVSALELRGDVAWDGGAAGLGARLRMIGDDLAGQDWDEAADWIALVRYVVMRNRAEREAARLQLEDGEQPPAGWRLGLAAGALGDVRAGTATVIDGFTTAVLADRRATGVHARAARGDWGGEVIVGDVTRGTLIAAAGAGRAGSLVVLGTAAVDPGLGPAAPIGAVSGAAGLEGRIERARGRVVLDLGWEPALGAGAALVADGDLRVGDRVILRARGELGAGTGGYVAAPFGPLYLRLRDHAGGMDETLVARARAHELGGVGGAGSLAVAVDDVGELSAGARHRPGLGTELTARAAAPALAGLQAAALAAWMPAHDDALLVGAEAHAELGRGLWSALELARQYRSGDEMLDADRAVWQVTAWFGWMH